MRRAGMSRFTFRTAQAMATLAGEMQVTRLEVDDGITRMMTIMIIVMTMVMNMTLMTMLMILAIIIMVMVRLGVPRQDCH